MFEWLGVYQSGCLGACDTCVLSGLCVVGYLVVCVIYLYEMVLRAVGLDGWKFEVVSAFLSLCTRSLPVEVCFES